MLGDDLLELAREPSSEKRSALLRRIADLFFDGTSERNVSEAALFDEIVIRVMKDLDVTGRALFAERVADQSRASRRLAMAIARDEIVVAKPVLERSPVLEDRDLVNLAVETGDEHLQAMSRRRVLSSMVTDVLLRRGSGLVRHLLAANAGARFSMQGFDKLMRHARSDETLQYDLANRNDLPEDVATTLSTLLTGKLSQTLQAMGLRGSEAQAPQMLEKLRESLSAAFESKEVETREIAAIVKDVRAGTAGLDHELAALVRADRGFDIATLVSDLLGIDHATAMKALTSPNEEPLIVMFRCLDVGWEAFEAMMQLRARRRGETYVRSASLSSTYQEMDGATARRVLRFLQNRRATQTRAA